MKLSEKLTELENLFKQRSAIMQAIKEDPLQNTNLININHRIASEVGDVVQLHCLLIGHLNKVLSNYKFLLKDQGESL